MGKDKRKGKERGSSFDYMFGTGEIGRMMDRYGVKGTKITKLDNRGVGGGGDVNDGSPRTRDDVDRDIAKAMMNDYDTRRGMEAAAMAGDKESKKFAKKGFKQGNIYSAWDQMKALKKEHVGGGGMNGPKNRASLTQALVQHDRDVFNESIDSRIAASQEKEVEDSVENTVDPEPEQPSKQLEQAQTLVDVYKQDLINNYIDDYQPNASEESIAGLKDSFSRGTYARQLKTGGGEAESDVKKGMTSQDFLNVYKDNVKSSLSPA